jgi:hypothetical protein
MVPYGERMVSLPGGMEADQNDVCPFCSKAMDWYPETDDYGKPYMQFDPAVFTDAHGTNWCDERCEVLSRLDQRWFYLQRVKDAIAFELPEVAGMYAKQLVTFALAFDVISEVTEGVF